MVKQGDAKFRKIGLLFCLLSILIVSGCVPPTTDPNEPEAATVENELAEDPSSNCLDKTVEIPGNAPLIEFSYSETPIATQLAESDLIVLGTISAISHTCFNQNSGEYYQDALPYFQIHLTIEEILQQQLDLDQAELVLTQVGYSPLDDAAASPFAVGDQAVALVVARELAWQGGARRPILRPFDYFGSSLLLAQPDGTFASSNGQTALTLAEIRSQLAVGEDGEVQVLGCAAGGQGVFTPEDVRCYLDTFDPELVWMLDEETAVLFTTPDPIADWIGGAIIYHISTVSTLVLDINGEVDEQFTAINGRTAQLAFDTLMADTETMTNIQQRVQELWQTGSGTTAPLTPGLVYQGNNQGCGSIFVYKANNDEDVSEFLTVFIPAPDFSLSAEPTTLQIADYPEEITVKIDLFGGRVYDLGEFPYCNDVGPEAEPQSVWLAESGTLTITVNGTVPEESCAGEGFQTTIRLENIVFRQGEDTMQLDEAAFEDVYVGWCAG